MGLRILLAVAGSADSEAAVRLVANIPWPADTSVHVLTVAPECWPYLGPNLRDGDELAEVLARMRQVDRAGCGGGRRVCHCYAARQ